jgi:F420-dependent oxidoreductase-like protein
MDFGAQLVNYFTDWAAVRPTLATVQAGSWRSLWFSDHFLPPVPGAGLEAEPALEGWSLITAAAAVTERLELGLMVTGNTYRNPALLAKMAATVDQISNGRLLLGIGAAWYQREHEAYGWEFPSVKERCDRLEEAVEVIKLLFTADGAVDYTGRYYKLDQAPFTPKCTQTPHVPILVGGNGEKRTLRTCARFADVCNIDFNNPGSPELFKRKLEVLERHCESFGRDASEIRKTMLIPLRLEDDEAKAVRMREQRGDWVLFGPPAFVIDRIGDYIAAGAEEIMFSSVPTRPEYFERIDSDVLSAFR